MSVSAAKTEKQALVAQSEKRPVSPTVSTGDKVKAAFKGVQLIVNSSDNAFGRYGTFTWDPVQ